MLLVFYHTMNDGYKYHIVSCKSHFSDSFTYFYTTIDAGMHPGRESVNELEASVFNT